jgi:hypothetical protein
LAIAANSVLIALETGASGEFESTLSVLDKVCSSFYHFVPIVRFGDSAVVTLVTVCEMCDCQCDSV